MGNAGQAAYAASKAGLMGLTKSLARELGGRNITANVVTPGYIDTDMTKDFPEERRSALLQQIPLNRLGTPEDIAHLVTFLCSQQSAYVTGQVIGINGGLYM
jgi:3-oxoacyl-[acyl-carrier protein] reductase